MVNYGWRIFCCQDFASFEIHKGLKASISVRIVVGLESTRTLFRCHFESFSSLEKNGLFGKSVQYRVPTPHLGKLMLERLETIEADSRHLSVLHADGSFSRLMEAQEREVLHTTHP